MTALAMLAGALILLAGILAGRFLPARRKGPGLVEAVCGCKHHYSMHDPGTGACHGTGRVRAYIAGERAGYAYKPCPCVRYTGPEPLPQFYAPAITGEAGQ